MVSVGLAKIDVEEHQARPGFVRRAEGGDLSWLEVEMGCVEASAGLKVTHCVANVADFVDGDNAWF